MKTRALFAGVFAVLLALALLPGAFAQWTGASPEEEETGKVPEAPEFPQRSIISALYVIIGYEMFPVIGACGQGLEAAGHELPFIGIELYPYFLPLMDYTIGLIYQLLGGEKARSAMMDTFTGASPKMMPAFYYGCGEIFARWHLERLAYFLDRIIFGLIELGYLFAGLPCGIGWCWFQLYDEIMQFMVGGDRHSLWPEVFDHPSVIVRLPRAGGGVAI